MAIKNLKAPTDHQLNLKLFTKARATLLFVIVQFRLLSPRGAFTFLILSLLAVTLFAVLAIVPADKT